jgi:dolichol-phosphate mannosyltransferase
MRLIAVRSLCISLQSNSFPALTDSIVIIPTYNERENIEKILRAVMGLDKKFSALIIDDGSPDGTAEIVKGMQKEFEGRINLVERKGKLGLGTAYITGFHWALDNNFTYIFEMDADFSHNPADLERLYAACHGEGADVAIGSRYVTGVNVVNWPMGRVIMSYYASKYVRTITGMPFRDSTAGFICYHRKVLESIDMDHIKFRGYAFQIEMKFAAWKHGFNIVEVPIIFTDRSEGASKMNKGIFKEAVFGVVEMKLKSLFRKYPERP